MDERDSERGSLHLSAFVAGALVGAGMALLLTPQPGAEVRACYGATPLNRERTSGARS